MGKLICFGVGVAVLLLIYYLLIRKEKNTVPKISKFAEGANNAKRKDKIRLAKKCKGIAKKGRGSTPEQRIQQERYINLANDIMADVRARDQMGALDFTYLVDEDELNQVTIDAMLAEDLAADFAELEQMLVETARVVPPVATVPRDDPQNVHDHVVQKDVKRSLEVMAADASGGINYEDELLAEIEKLGEQKRSNAKGVVEYIKVNRNIEISSLGKRLGEIYEVTLQRCHEKECMDALALEMTECYNGNGGLLCVTGIATRIVGSLDGIDDEVKIRPEWALREELLGKASVYSAADNNSDEILKKLHTEFDPIFGGDVVTRLTADWINHI